MDFKKEPSMSESNEKSVLERLERIRRSQMEYGVLFGKLNTIINQLREKYPHDEDNHLNDDADSTEDHSSGASSSSEMVASSQRSNSSGTSSSLQQPLTNRQSLKRKFSLEESDDYIDSDAADEYPKRVREINDFDVADEVIIGPNGTRVEYHEYKEIPWSTAASATRTLLNMVFSNDTLATHTLTGKPSPAFYGRERPAKMQLDPLKTADIIHCVLAKCDSGNEREIRSTITTKCADTAKRYKRRSLKLNNSNVDKW